MNTIDNDSIDASRNPVPVVRVQYPERRRHPRLAPSALSAIMYVGELRHVISIGDISISGAKILNAPPGLTEGETIELVTCLHGSDRMTVQCTVAHIKGNAAQMEVGVSFKNMDDSDSHVIVSYLRWLLDSEVENAKEAMVPEGS